MARALIVGCGCRGRGLGRALLDAGWQVRGTSRDSAALAEIEAAGIEPLLADPDHVGTVLEGLEGVTLIYWLLGAAAGPTEAVAALHGSRLERLLEEIVDTPVRGFVYEATSDLPSDELVGALSILAEAGRRWRIPFEVVDADPSNHQLWLTGMTAAAAALTEP